MSTLDQIRHGFQNAIESLAEGWRALRERASQALTRFTHHPKGGGAEDQLMASASRWGLLAAEPASSVALFHFSSSTQIPLGASSARVLHFWKVSQSCL